MALTGLDIIVLLIIGVATLLGFMRGFVGEAMSLAAWVVAIIAVKALHEPVASVLREPVGTDTGASVLAFAIVFGLSFLAVKMIGARLGRASRASALGPIDRILGGGFGATKGLIAATIAFLFVSLVFDTLHGASSARPDWMTKSRTYPLLHASGTALVDYVEKRRAS